MLCHWICLQVGQVHWELYTCNRLPMNPLLRKLNHFRFALHLRKCAIADFDFQSVTQEYIETARQIVWSVFFQRSTLKLWNCQRIPTDAFWRKKKWCEWVNLKNNFPCRSADAMVTLIFPKGWASQSLSLSLFLFHSIYIGKTVWIQIRPEYNTGKNVS